MKKQRKFEIVDELRNELGSALAVVIVDFKGTTVEQMQNIRATLRAESGKIRVVKNTLLEKAVAGTIHEPIGKFTGGQVAILWSDTDPGFPAKVAVKYAEDYKSVVIKGAVLSGEPLDAAGVDQLSKLPSKDELRQQFLGLLLAAPQKLLRVLNAVPRDFLGVLAAREKSLNEAA